MNRPAPRKSSLSGTSALTPPPAMIPDPVAPAAVVQPPEARAARPAAPTSKKPGSSRMNYYVDADQSGRIRTAYLIGRARYGWRSLTEFQLDTIMERVVALEAELNNGQQFEPSSAGSVSAGRPIE